MIRKFQDKLGSNCIDVDDTIRFGMLRIVQLTDSDECCPALFELSFWHYGSYSATNGFWTRLKAAWKILRTGYSYDSVVFDSETLKELKEAL